MIELKGIHKAFGMLQVLRGIDVTIPEGKTVVVIGCSGTGKSVTLKHMVGLLKPDQGQILVDGEDITHYKPHELLKVRRKFGMLFQSSALLKWLTCFENVALPLRELSTMNESELEDRVMEKLQLLNVAGARDKFPNEISGGMQKRVGLARAIIWNPTYVLYDEPTSGLDPVITARVDHMINDTKEKLGVSSVVVSHDMASVYRIADKVVMLHQGKVVHTGPPEDFKDSDDPIINQFVKGELEGPISRDLERQEKAG